MVSCKDDHPRPLHERSPGEVVSFAVVKVDEAYLIAKGIPRLAMIEQAAREYVLLVKIEGTIPESDWLTIREAELAHKCGERVLSELRAEAPLLLHAENALLDLSGALSNACSLLGRRSEIGHDLSEQRRKVLHLVEDVRLAAQVLSDPQSVSGVDSYDPRIVETLEEVRSSLKTIEKNAQHAAASDGDKSQI